MITATQPPRVSFASSPEPPTHDILTNDELAALFRPLARDYQAAIVFSAGLGFRDRARVLRQRLAAYSDALARSLGDAHDGATAVLRGPRRIGGRR
jgi:hypothetical protein